MPNDKELYKVTISSPFYKTVFDYLDDVASPAHMYVDKPEAFLSIVSPDDKLSNRQRLEEILKKNPETARFVGKDAKELPLKTGVIFYLEYDKVNYQSFVTEGIEVVSYDTVAFKAEQIARLESDTNYRKVNEISQTNFQDGVSEHAFPACTVWIWCRALSSKGEEQDELKGQFFDLSPFIQKVSTGVGKNGGNFQITLPPLVCELDEFDRKWKLKAADISQFEEGEFVAQGSSFTLNEEGTGLRRNRFFFNTAIRSNDLLLIRFETLEMEKYQRYEDAKNYTISKSNIPNRIYDMIGLVDNVSDTFQAAANDVTINITGRDLSKLFIDDGTYFYALENSAGQLKFAGQSTLENGQLNRIFGEGALDFIALYMHSPIEHIIKFIIQQLSNIKIVPTELFEDYGKRRNQRYNVVRDFKKNDNPDFDYKAQSKPEPAKGIWQIVKPVIDKSVLGRLLQDTSFSTAQGSLLNFIKTACQEPLVQFYMDTYGDMYHLIIRKPPYDQKALVSLLEGRVSTEEGKPDVKPVVIDIEAEHVVQENLSMDDSQVYSWYSFFPRNQFSGSSTSLQLSYLGAIYFEEYAQIWGAKPLQQEHPYIPFIPSNDNTQGVGIYEKQAILDLKYLVECNQYLPFTRKGTIVLSSTDRRIKIGNIIRYKPTGEIFFVDHVQHNYQISDNSIDSSTMIQVSRGMVEQFIYGKHLQDSNGNQIYISYFNLINTKLVLDKTKTVPTKEYIKIAVTKTVDGSAPFRNGFGEYMMHQQGVRGARNIATAIKKGTDDVPRDVRKNMWGNATGYVGEKTVAGWYNYWIRRYNKAYDYANSHTSQYESIYQSVAKETGVPVDAIRAFAEIESGNKQVTGATGTYIGIMQINKYMAAKDFKKYNVHDPRDNVKIAALIYKGNSPYNPFEHFSGEKQQVTTEEVTEKEGTTTIMDRDAVFSNFKVNKSTFNFFLKNLQFDPEYLTVTNREVYNPDQAGTLPDIIVTATKKK